MKFKVGDKVITLKECDHSGTLLFPVGTIGTITEICSGSDLSYKVEAEDDYWYYSEDMIGKVVERKSDMKKEFTKDDLKDGMIVEYRTGVRRLVVGNILYGIDSYTTLDTHNHDLTYHSHGLDIMKVYDGYAEALRIVLESPGKLIWEREHKIKDVSAEEIYEALKEKYPGFAEFNLPFND